MSATLFAERERGDADINFTLSLGCGVGMNGNSVIVVCGGIFIPKHVFSRIKSVNPCFFDGDCTIPRHLTVLFGPVFLYIDSTIQKGISMSNSTV